MKAIYTLFIALVFTSYIYGQGNADKIVGTYLAPDGTSKMEFFKDGKTYSGKIVWLKNPNDPKTNKPNTDTENPDKSKRNQPILGLVIAKNLKFNGKNTWEDGTIYDPNTGKTWDCNITLEGSSLKIKGYWKFSWIGKAETWFRL
jgi:uncharacterized protein (DUF2147 family)